MLEITSSLNTSLVSISSLSLKPALIESMQTLPQTKNGEWKSNPHLAKQAGEWKMLAKPNNFFWKNSAMVQSG